MDKKYPAFDHPFGRLIAWKELHRREGRIGEASFYVK